MGLSQALIKSNWIRLIALLSIVLGALGAPILRNVQGEDLQSIPGVVRGGRLYPETGKTLAEEFIAFYDKYGGVLQFGYPVTEARIEEVSPGKGYLVQWTERQRLEFHPEYGGTPYEVLLGLLGRELTEGLEGPRFQRDKEEVERMKAERVVGIEGDPLSLIPSTLSFEETGQTIGEPFLSYWREKGGLAVYGYPISTAYRDDDGLLVQWFERARFEHHPEYAEHPVLLGHLGLETLKGRDAAYYEVEVSGEAVEDKAPSIELAQGGESEDPRFLDNVRDAGRALGPGLVRLDNIFNFYGIVERGSDGDIRYRWDEFDVALDAVRAMGKEPFICLSYMPETMSVSGLSRTMPPGDYAEWGALVRATVEHVNVERGLGVRYWEVWNEPDQWGFWQGSYGEYLRLYDVTAEAIRSVDPGARIGGPSVSRFSADHLEEFLSHEAGLAEGLGRVDFVSWHEYGQSAEGLAGHIREARSIAARYPQFRPELFVTEFNVLQGGAGDTSANGHTDRVEGAIALLASIESMQRERLDRAFVFELKDGKGPQEYWGRWGILTNGGLAKPIYHVYRAYQGRPEGMLPVMLKEGREDGSLGILAYGGAGEGTIFLWYTGEGTAARVKVGLPERFGGRRVALTLFDEGHNNPAGTGEGPGLSGWMERDAGDLVMELKPNSLVIMEVK